MSTLKAQDAFREELQLDPTTFLGFYGRCKRLLVSESLHFFLAVEEYRSLHPALRLAYEQDIWEQFIHDGSPEQINITADIKKKIVEQLGRGHSQVFDKAQLACIGLLAFEPWNDWKQSPEFARMQETKSLRGKQLVKMLAQVVSTNLVPAVTWIYTGNLIPRYQVAKLFLEEEIHSWLLEKDKAVVIPVLCKAIHLDPSLVTMKSILNLFSSKPKRLLALVEAVVICDMKLLIKAEAERHFVSEYSATSYSVYRAEDPAETLVRMLCLTRSRNWISLVTKKGAEQACRVHECSHVQEAPNIGYLEKSKQREIEDIASSTRQTLSRIACLILDTVFANTRRFPDDVRHIMARIVTLAGETFPSETPHTKFTMAVSRLFLSLVCSELMAPLKTMDFSPQELFIARKSVLVVADCIRCLVEPDSVFMRQEEFVPIFADMRRKYSVPLQEFITEFTSFEQPQAFRHSREILERDKATEYVSIIAHHFLLYSSNIMQASDGMPDDTIRTFLSHNLTDNPISCTADHIVCADTEATSDGNITARSKLFRCDPRRFSNLGSWIDAEIGKSSCTILIAIKGPSSSSCKKYLQSFRKYVSKIALNNGTILALTSLPQDQCNKVAEEWKLNFPIIGDPNRELSTKFAFTYDSIQKQYQPGVLGIQPDGTVLCDWKFVSSPLATGIGLSRRASPKSVFSTCFSEAPCVGLITVSSDECDTVEENNDKTGVSEADINTESSPEGQHNIEPTPISWGKKLKSIFSTSPPPELNTPSRRSVRYSSQTPNKVSAESSRLPRLHMHPEDPADIQDSFSSGTYDPVLSSPEKSPRDSSDSIRNRTRKRVTQSHDGESPKKPNKSKSTASSPRDEHMMAESGSSTPTAASSENLPKPILSISDMNSQQPYLKSLSLSISTDEVEISVDSSTNSSTPRDKRAESLTKSLRTKVSARAVIERGSEGSSTLPLELSFTRSSSSSPSSSKSGISCSPTVGNALLPPPRKRRKSRSPIDSDSTSSDNLSDAASYSHSSSTSSSTPLGRRWNPVDVSTNSEAGKLLPASIVRHNRKSRSLKSEGTEYQTIGKTSDYEGKIHPSSLPTSSATSPNPSKSRKPKATRNYRGVKTAKKGCKSTTEDNEKNNNPEKLKGSSGPRSSTNENQVMGTGEEDTSVTSSKNSTSSKNTKKNKLTSSKPGNTPTTTNDNGDTGNSLYFNSNSPPRHTNIKASSSHSKCKTPNSSPSSSNPNIFVPPLGSTVFDFSDVGAEVSSGNDSIGPSLHRSLRSSLMMQSMPTLPTDYGTESESYDSISGSWYKGNTAKSFCSGKASDTTQLSRVNPKNIDFPLLRAGLKAPLGKGSKKKSKLCSEDFID